jgi:Flp pilus assembly protein TadG
MRKTGKEDLGANAVEFALILPLLLLLIFGLIDFSRMGFVQLSVTSASREGARLSSLYSSGIADTTQIITFVRQTAPQSASISQLTQAANLNVLVTPCSSVLEGENTTVQVSTSFAWLLPTNLLKIVAPKSTLTQGFTISSTGTMRCMN